MPERIQRKRTKGWRMPENTVYVGRPTKWGNPWNEKNTIQATGKDQGKGITPKQAVSLYRAALKRSADLREQARTELAGKNLACWCPLDQPCHADVLLEIAN